ncbi:tail fiber protein [Algibacter sp. AS12]|uniref:phage tail protein n=1 Tax=Algibacter sp. AS12 TaxID=3135773 RepID=UPI00398AEA95
MKKHSTVLCLILISFFSTNQQTQAQSANPIMGEVAIFAGNFAPRGWAFCQGQLLPIAQNTALFSILGTTYGGDGRTTFGLPDLRGRAAMHPGRGPGLTSRSLGERVGTETVTITPNQMPNHTHSVNVTAQLNVSNDMGTSDSSDGQHLANHLGGYNEDPTPNAKLGGVTSSTTVTPTGGGQAHNNMQPSLSINYIIALTGTYPSRS